MNLSSLSGVATASLFESGATVKNSTISSAGVVINVTGEKGLASISATGSNGNNNIVSITIDGVSFSGAIGEIARVISQNDADPSGTNRAGFDGLIYKNSLRVEVLTHVSTTAVIVARIS